MVWADLCCLAGHPDATAKGHRHSLAGSWNPFNAVHLQECRQAAADLCCLCRAPRCHSHRQQAQSCGQLNLETPSVPFTNKSASKLQPTCAALQDTRMPQPQATGVTWGPAGIPSAAGPGTAWDRASPLQSCALCLQCCWPTSGTIPLRYGRTTMLSKMGRVHKQFGECVVLCDEYAEGPWCRRSCVDMLCSL